MRTRHTRVANFLIVGLTCFTLVSCSRQPETKDEAAWIRDNPDLGVQALPQDEKGTLYPAHPYDAFKGMDSHVKDVYGHEFSADEIEGRNTWVMWSGGNQEFWDYLAQNSNGIVDFLKLCDSRFIQRNDRFRVMGLVPHPGMKQTDPGADPGEPNRANNYGLHLDGYTSYEGAAGAYVEGPPPDPKVYGYASGIVGLRLFPREEDPDPRIRREWEQNRDRWDPDRYLADEDYYKDPGLVRPFRVGMSCGFCHISANPMNPPDDMSFAKWENLSSNIGAQYFRFGRIFGADFKRDNLLHQLLNYAEPGTLDTSLVATDGNNNPNTMNSVFQLLPRIVVSLKSPKERTPPDTLKYMPRLDESFDIDGDGGVTGPNDIKAVVFDKPGEVDFLRYLGLPEEVGEQLPTLGDTTSRHTPKILADGADSVGGRGALCRVYLNIGEYSDEWRQIQNTMIGITAQQPFRMEQAAENSVNWNVTMRRSTNVAKYFLAGSVPMRLEDAIRLAEKKQAQEASGYGDQPDPYGSKAGSEVSLAGYVLPNNDPKVIRGAEIFARDCFVCHSSVGQPDEFWADAGNWKKWVQTPGYVENAQKLIVDLLMEEVTPLDPAEHQHRRDVNDPFFEGFVKTNYLSTEARYHVSDIGTNTARALADNGGRRIRGVEEFEQPPQRMWNDYSSFEFKEQPRLSTTVDIAHPYDEGRTIPWKMLTEAGPGRYRPQSLSSMWAHGPYLHNNSVGYYPNRFLPDPRRGMEGESLAVFTDDVQSIAARVRIFEDGTRRLLGLQSTHEPDDYAAYRGFSKDQARRGFDSIVRIEKDAKLSLPAAVVPDLVYMQSMALLGIGIPPWVQFLVLIGLVLVGIILIVKGANRLREGKSMLLRNLGFIVIGVVLIGTLWMLWQKEDYEIGHIPKGTPVNLVVNLNGPEWATGTPERRRLLALALVGLKKADKYQVETLEDKRLTVHGRPLVDILIALSKCPDLILDKGHEFGEYETVGLANKQRVLVPEADREALIEFLKKL